MSCEMPVVEVWFGICMSSLGLLSSPAVLVWVPALSLSHGTMTREGSGCAEQADRSETGACGVVDMRAARVGGFL